MAQDNKEFSREISKPCRESRIMTHWVKPCLVTTTFLSRKISEVENKNLNHYKYITTPEFNKLTAENFTARLKQANLVNKNDFDKN